MHRYVPPKLPAKAPLVVALHGCGQTAASFDHGAGWSALAKRLGFALLLPEQRRANNFNRCFDWFSPGDMERDQGEPGSIRQMVDRMVTDHGLDADRIYVAGLSAGGAMTSTLLATYPDVFASGAIIAGMPYKAAYGKFDALNAMVHGRVRPSIVWAGLVRAAALRRGRPPRVSIWHGDADRTVNPVNGAECVKQWVGVHRLARSPSVVDKVSGHTRNAWLDRAGETVIEEYIVKGMAHGTPVKAGATAGARGSMTAPYAFDMGIACVEHIAWFWGLSKKRPGRWTKPRR
jgi:poly(hydroxyalkanoate) depolymerase family esterase